MFGFLPSADATAVKQHSTVAEEGGENIFATRVTLVMLTSLTAPFMSLVEIKRVGNTTLYCNQKNSQMLVTWPRYMYKL